MLVRVPPEGQGHMRGPTRAEPTATAPEPAAAPEPTTEPTSPAGYLRVRLEVPLRQVLSLPRYWGVQEELQGEEGRRHMRGAAAASPAASSA